jgi:DNA-binding CsgD family transcriptional regulator
MYASAHDDARMPAFLDALARATDSSSSSVLVQDPVSNSGSMALNSFDDETYAQAYAAHADGNVLLEAALPHSRTGAVVVSNDYLADRELMSSPFYDAVCRPFYAHYTMGLCLVVDSASVAGVVLNRDRSRPFTEADRRFGRRLMPHLQTWFRLRQRIGGLEVQKQEGLDALEALDYGAIILDGTGVIRQVNAAARRLIDASGGALVLGRTLGSRSASTDARLAGAVRAVAGEDAAGKVISIETPGGAMQLAVMPLRASEPEPAQRRVIVVVQDRALAEMRAVKALEARFDLTQAELRVAMQILAGRSVRRAADRLGLSPETVKTHLRAIYRKTETGGQAEFVATVAGFIVS